MSLHGLGGRRGRDSTLGGRGRGVKDEMTCIRCKEYDPEGEHRQIMLDRDRAPFHRYACQRCAPLLAKEHGHAFYVECDRCGDRSSVGTNRLPLPDEFGAWGRGYPGQGGVGRCVRCDVLCGVCARESDQTIPEWTLVRKLGACSATCAIAILLSNGHVNSSI